MSYQKIPNLGELPCIELRFSSTVLLVALIDSGCDQSYIHGDAFNEVNASFGFSLDTDFIIGSAGYSDSASTHLIFGSIDLKANVGDSSFTGNFKILVNESSLDFHIILGVDILRKLQAVFDFGNWQLSPTFVHPLKFLTPARICELMGYPLNEILDQSISDAEL